MSNNPTRQYALSDCENYETNTLDDCGGRVQEIRFPGQGDVILCENCLNKKEPLVSPHHESEPFEGTDSDTTDESTFRVTRMGGGQPYRTKSYTPAGDEGDPIMYEFLAPNGERLGLVLKGDGSLSMGGWDAEGIWVDLIPKRPCRSPHCQKPNQHSSEFPLDQYTEGE